MEKSAPTVLVTHPGRQHSHQAALALQKAGMLGAYWAGVPSVPAHLGSLPGALIRRRIRYPMTALDDDRARWIGFAPLLRRAGDTFLPARAAARVDLFACRAFDRWVARRLDEVDAAAVIACEISALDTFRKAKQRGWKTLLDAPSFHHAAQDRLHGFHEAPSLHRRILAVKNHEIALADHVLTVSELARETYLEAGVQPEKVHAVPLGADLARFQPGAEPPTSEAVTFLFAGASIHRKGFDLLVGAFGRVLGEAPSARLRVVGPRGELAQLTADLPPGAVVLTGPVPQEELAAELRRADCLVLPSRNDSYGMVVAESLASGTPVIVSEMVGAKDLVIEGVSGWTVPMEDVDALTSRMLRCAHDPEALRSMGSAARAAAETATWEAYQGRFARLVETLLAEPGR